MKLRAAAYCSVTSVILFFIASTLFAQSDSGYKNQMGDWYLKRLHALKAPNGWLNLAGLYWLEQGKNSFGSEPGNKLVYNSPGMPPKAGDFLLKGGKVKWISKKNVTVRMQNKRVRQAYVYDAAQKIQPVLSMGALRWSVIKRDDRLGVRLRDLNHPALEKIQSLDYFPLDTAWRIAARFEAKEKDSLQITNMVGQTYSLKSPGKLIFSIGTQTYFLDALENTADELLIIIADLTNGEETYASGRYIYMSKPDASGNVVLDFNKAVNPPCVFTEFATCPLPPRQNRLQIKIRAGEKMYKME